MPALKTTAEQSLPKPSGDVMHTFSAAPPSTVEGASLDQDNAMVAVGPFGEKVYYWPTSADEALIYHVEHGAEAMHPDRWPWRGDTVVPLPPDASEFCPAPDICFPLGLPVGAVAAACVHTGGQTHWIGEKG